MKKEILFFLMLISVLFIISAGCAKKQTVPGADIPAIAELRTTLMDDCVKESVDQTCLAYADRNAKACNAIEDQKDKEACITEITATLAYQQNKPDRCTNTPHPDLCKAYVLGDQFLCGGDVACEAIALRDKKHCQNIRSSNNCELGFDYAVAMVQEDSNLCHGDLYCEVFVSGSTVACTTTVHDLCTQKVKIQLGFATGDFDCDNMDPTLKPKCIEEKESYFLNKGANEKDEQQCNQIQNKAKQEACLSIGFNDLERCNLVEDEIQRLYCTKQLFDSNNKRELCSSFRTESLKQDCFSYYDKYYGDLETT